MSEAHISDALQELITIFSAVPFNQLLGIKIDHVNPEEAHLSISMKKDLIGNYLQGILHGGVISTLLDMAGGVAAVASATAKLSHHSTAELVTLLGKSSTINLHINYLRPGKGENFKAIAKVLHSGNKVCSTRMELYNDKNILITTGSASYLIA